MPEVRTPDPTRTRVAVSWTLGFLTPGAPSGIGVREAVLVFLLSPLVGSAEAIILSILFRLVTVGGDVMFWLMMEAKERYDGAPVPDHPGNRPPE